MSGEDKYDLFIAADYPPTGGGEAAYIEQLSKHYPAPFKVLTLNTSTPHSDNDNVIRTGRPGYFAPIFFLLYILFRLRKKEIRFIHCAQLRSIGPVCLLLKIFFGIPYGVHVYGGERSKYADKPLWRSSIKPILKNARQVFAISRWTAQQFMEYGVPEKKVSIVAPPVDTDRFHPEEDRDSVRKKLDINDRKVLLTVCRLDPHKGTDMVIWALPELIEDFPEVLFVVGGSGRMEEKLKAMAEELNVSSNVRFIGRVPDEDLNEWYSASDIFIMPSRIGVGKDRGIEGFGIVYLEANLCGRPVIGGRSGGVPDAVEEGVNGFLVDPESPTEIAGAVRCMFGDPALADRMGESGRNRALSYFSGKILAERLFRLTCNCCD